MATSQALPTPPRPDFGRLYGITYDPTTRNAMIRVPKVLKVGIGIPKGRAIQIFLYNGAWHIRHGVWEDSGNGKKKLVMKTMFKGGQSGFANTRQAAEEWHNKYKDQAAVSNRPQKQSWFTFTRRIVVEGEGGKPTEMFEPDFDAIEAHGDCPRRIPVILTSENPLQQALEFWSATELKCHGDGLTAERVLSMGSEKDENWKSAKGAGLKMFYYSPCAINGCTYYGKECKPHSTLSLQLAHAQRLGATAYFTTTGIVSAGRLFSSISEIRQAVEMRGYSIAGIPMDLVLDSFRANHEGKPSIQPCVSLELTAAGTRALQQILAEHSWVPARLGEAPKLIAAPEEPVYDAPTEVLAGAIHAEFSDASDADFEEGTDDAPITATAEPVAATATHARQEGIGEKLKNRKQPAEVTAPAVAAPAPAATAPVAAAAEPTQEPAKPMPWSDRATFNAVLVREKERMGEAAFERILKPYGMIGLLKFDDPKAMDFYATLQAHHAGAAEFPAQAAPAAPAKAKSEPLF